MKVLSPEYERFMLFCHHMGYKISRIMELQSELPQLAQFTKEQTLEHFKMALTTKFKYGIVYGTQILR